VTDGGLAHLNGLTRLSHLNLSNTQIGDAGLAHLTGLTALTELDLTNTQITDAGLRYLTQLTNLETLTLKRTLETVTSAGVDDLRQSMPWLKHFIHTFRISK